MSKEWKVSHLIHSGETIFGTQTGEISLIEPKDDILQFCKDDSQHYTSNKHEVSFTELFLIITSYNKDQIASVFQTLRVVWLQTSLNLSKVHFFLLQQLGLIDLFAWSNKVSSNIE